MDPDCHYWTFENLICKLFRIHTDLVPSVSVVSEFSNIETGFKHCNLASSDKSKWVVDFPGKENPFDIANDLGKLVFLCPVHLRRFY